MRKLLLMALMCVLAIPTGTAAAAARPFQPNFILDDSEFVEGDSMSAETIQRFLAAQPGTLATGRFLAADGQTRTAAEILRDAALKHRINPKVLIVLLQKEQSLVEDPSPAQGQFDWAMGYAVCDSCDKNDPALQPFKGFATQVDRAAGRLRYYLDHPTEFAIRVAQPYTIDGVIVTPLTQATANLYIYTPHLHGNENFWTLWQEYFGRYYPDGTLVRDQLTNDIWLLQNGLRRQFLSNATLYADYDTNKIIDVPHADVERIDVGVPIRFSTYSLLRSPRGTIYLLDGDTRRGIPSREDFRLLGYHPDEVIDATWEELDDYPEGQPLTATEGNPVGQLLQDATSGGVHYVAEGVKHPIWHRDILANRFPQWPLKRTSPELLATYPTGEPVGFRDGELLVSADDPTVYVISNGIRRPFPSADVFEELGYQWTNIKRTATKAITAHELGDPVEL